MYEKLLNAPSELVTSNARLKIYPSTEVLQVSNRKIFKDAGWEVQRTYDVPPKGHGADPDRALENSRARARRAIRDIALCNTFDFFFTWTLDPALIDRYDSYEVTKKVQTFLKNATYRDGFTYICVPEKHDDGAIHFHGLCNLGSLKVKRAVNKGKELTTNKGQPIYNMVSWKWGFSTCIPLDGNYSTVATYVSKYITKSADRPLGKWYFSSRNLRRKPDIRILPLMDFDKFNEENPTAHTLPIFENTFISIITEG